MCSPLSLGGLLKSTIGKQHFLFWLHGVQFDSAVWCTLQRSSLQSDVMKTMEFLRYCVFLTPKKLEQLTPQYDMHTAESDLAVWCAPRRLTPWWMKDNRGRKSRDTLRVSIYYRLQKHSGGHNLLKINAVYASNGSYKKINSVLNVSENSYETKCSF